MTGPQAPAAPPFCQYALAGWFVFLLVGAVGYVAATRQGDRRTRKWLTSVPALLALSALVVVTGVVAAFWQTEPEPARSTARALLAVLRRGAKAFESPTTWLGIVLLVTLGPIVPLLRRHLSERLQSLTIGSLKLDLAPVAASVQMALLRDGVLGLDLREVPEFTRDLAGTDGPIRAERPIKPTPGYEACMKAVADGLFQRLTQDSQQTIHDSLLALEKNQWEGEYAEENALVAEQLLACARRKGVRLAGNLAKTLLFRHILLLVFYRADAKLRRAMAEAIVEALEQVVEEEQREFLQHEMCLWALAALGAEQSWGGIERIQAQATRLGITPTRDLFAAYLRVHRDNAPLTEDPTLIRTARGPYEGVFECFFFVLQAESYALHRRPLAAMRSAEAAIAVSATQSRGMHEQLRRQASRILAEESARLELHEQLYKLEDRFPWAKSDPVILNAIAVAAARQGHLTWATDLLWRALRASNASESTLRTSIERNLELALGRRR